MCTFISISIRVYVYLSTTPDQGPPSRPSGSLSVRSSVFEFCLVISLCSLSPLARKWGPPGHTGWCRGIFSDARDQSRAPLKTTHAITIAVCRLLLLSLSFAIALFSTSSLNHPLPRTLRGPISLLCVIKLIIPALSALSNILIILIVILSLK